MKKLAKILIFVCLVILIFCFLEEIIHFFQEQDNLIIELDDDFNGVSLNSNTYGEVVGLPEPAENTLYIVSSIVAHAVKGKRADCIIVDKTIRDEKNFIIGCKGFAVIR